MVTGLAAMTACKAADSFGEANALASDSSGFMAVPFLFRLQERDSLILLAPSPHWRWPVASKFAQS